MPGDKLVRVDGFNCQGVLRDDIKRRVLGHPNSEIILDFERAGQSVFKVGVLEKHNSCLLLSTLLPLIF